MVVDKELLERMINFICKAHHHAKCRVRDKQDPRDCTCGRNQIIEDIAVLRMNEEKRCQRPK